jgi:hypothetical protein
MGGTHHLRKIYDGQFLVCANHQIELVKIAMDETVACEIFDHIHCLVIDVLWVFEDFAFADWHAGDPAHQNRVAVGIDWLWGWEPVGVQGLHKKKFF